MKAMPMDRDTYLRVWAMLTEDISEIRDITTHKPILAHYTSMNVVESFLKERRLWLSNPRNMNDHQEVSFGIHTAINEVGRSESPRKAFGSEEAFRAFIAEIGALYDAYGKREVKDLFVACFSEHEITDLPDGKLSMWRGYGDFGNGAAVVFDTSKIGNRENTPFILSEVSYFSDKDRTSAIKNKVRQLAKIVAEEEVDPSTAKGLRTLSSAGPFWRPCSQNTLALRKSKNGGWHTSPTTILMGSSKK